MNFNWYVCSTNKRLRLPPGRVFLWPLWLIYWDINWLFFAKLLCWFRVGVLWNLGLFWGAEWSFGDLLGLCWRSEREGDDYGTATADLTARFSNLNWDLLSVPWLIFTHTLIYDILVVSQFCLEQLLMVPFFNLCEAKEHKPTLAKVPFTTTDIAAHIYYSESEIFVKT